MLENLSYIRKNLKRIILKKPTARTSRIHHKTKNLVTGPLLKAIHRKKNSDSEGNELFRMCDDLRSESSTSPRIYSDSLFLETGDARNRGQDLVFTNNQKNDKLNELSQVKFTKDDKNNEKDDGAGENGEDEEDDYDDDDDDGDDEEEEEVGNGEEGDEIDDDWFTKLANNKDFVRSDTTKNGTSLLFYGLNYWETPLLCDEDLDFKEKTMRTLRVGLKKIWRRGSATITAEDPTYKVAYLGNVLTGWAKGEGCVDKPLNTLWKNYNSSTKPDVQMKISVTQSGLKAVTKDHGLIEYWSNRITYCAVPSGLPRIFCWVYRHEGRKLKQELRCHAVLCSKESVAVRMAATLKQRLTQALVEFKRDKLLRQNARLSLANSVYENPSLPRRKILLSTGSHNYKPPLERSKSAPKLMSIEESLEEEESTPKVKRKLNENEREGLETRLDTEEMHKKKPNIEEKCEYKLANLNFVKKLCSSIENIVESTSNYRKKFLTERKSSKDFYVSLKRPEESILKKGKSGDRLEIGDSARKMKMKKNVSFVSSHFESSDSAKCMEYKKLGKDEREEQKARAEATEIRDQENDEGSIISLQSISSCCSDVSSHVPNSLDKSADSSVKRGDNELPDCLGGYQTTPERLHAYLSDYDDPGLLVTKVILHPTGEELLEEKHNSEEGEEDAASDESGYVELSENLDRRLSLDSKEKDLPYHKIIKSTMLKPGRTKPSCLHV